jgi:hypothetical protein
VEDGRWRLLEKTWMLFRGVATIGGDFYVGDAAEGEEQFYEVFGRLFGGLFDSVLAGSK